MKRMAVLLALCGAGVLALSLGAGVGQAGDKGKDKGKEQPKVPEVPPLKGKSEVIRLFNGKDFEGWEGHEKLWSIKDGTIIAKSTDPIKVSTYLLTKRKFTDFRLTATVKLVESEMHSGISFWGRKAPDKGDP